VKQATPSAKPIERYGKVLRIPAAGRLLISTDLHGNLADFERVVAAWEKRHAETGDAYLLFTGDLIHGPCYDRATWPFHLGDFYEDRSGELLGALIELMKKHPKRVFSLIGNHEHSHIGGPKTRKFHKDPSETEHFEKSVGPERTAQYKEVFRSLPIAAVCGKGIVVTHGAPRVLDASFAEICTVEYAGHSSKSIPQMIEVPILGELFWARAAGTLVVRRFLKRMDLPGTKNTIVVYGHDPVREGFAKDGLEQLCFSTSFACKNTRKVYLDLDLTKEYPTVDALRPGHELVPLYPELVSNAGERRGRVASAANLGALKPGSGSGSSLGKVRKASGTGTVKKKSSASNPALRPRD
jgi:hypothetical protein